LSPQLTCIRRILSRTTRSEKPRNHTSVPWPKNEALY
jgi:hypothetical protein